MSRATVSSTSVAAKMRSELAALEKQKRRDGQVMHDSASAKKVSPWLQTTRWPRYLEGYPLPCLAALAAPPQEGSPRVLHLLCSSLDRLVEPDLSYDNKDKLDARSHVGRSQSRQLFSFLKIATCVTVS
jgi:hypothetical protein